jgi:hypothetical protein
MRRIAAHTLVFIFSWMLIAPLFAPGAEASLPPCCRRHGKHHCSMMEPLTGSQRGVQTVQEKCPFSHVAKTTAHTALYHPQTPAAQSLPVVSGPALAPQSQTLSKLALHCSRMKRGPPLNLL